MLPILNIRDRVPDVTIAFWIRLSKPNQRVRIFWLTDFEIFFRERMSLCFTGTSPYIYCAPFTSWIHIAVTFEQGEVKIFINGETFRTVTTSVGRNVKTCIVQYVSSPLIMDLHIFGFALPRDDIYDLSRGKQFVYFMKRLNTLFHEIIACK